MQAMAAIARPAYEGGYPRLRKEQMRVISKVLVANRGQIAIRAFRAAYQLGIATMAVPRWGETRCDVGTGD